MYIQNKVDKMFAELDRIDVWPQITKSVNARRQVSVPTITDSSWVSRSYVENHVLWVSNGLQKRVRQL